MKVIAQIRRERLAQLVRETGLTYADISVRLGRSRRDATLSQIANAAKNTRTGRPRQMGDDQARALEAAFDKPQGWFDADPDLDARIGGSQSAQSAAWAAREGTTAYTPAGWPFARVRLRDLLDLSASQALLVETMLLSALALAKNDPHQKSAGTGTTG